MIARRWATLLVSAALWPAIFAHDARAADPPPRAEQKAAAQALFEQGRTLLEQGHASDACPKFAESQRLDPGIGTMLWLADCQETAGQTASAWAAFKEAAAAATLRNDPRAKVARERAAQLEPKLIHLTILVAPQTAAQGVEVRRDGILIESAQFGLPVPVDPGVHTINAEAPHRKAWSTTVDLTATTLPITIPLLKDDVSDPPTMATADVPDAETAMKTSDGSGQASGSRGSTQRIAGLAVGGAGLAAIVVGAIFGLDAKATYDKSNANNHCVDNACDAAGKTDRGDASGLASTATVTMAVGLAAAAGGAVLYLTAPKAGRPTIGVAFLPESGGGGFKLRASW